MVAQPRNAMGQSALHFLVQQRECKDNIQAHEPEF